MEYKRFGNKFIVRINKGEEIITTLKELCKNSDIKLGSISGIGAANKIVVGLFDTNEKKYYSKELIGDYEITNLTGNITTMNGEIYLHIHATLSDIDCNAFGGHLNLAVISATCEIFIDIIDGLVERELNQEIGINLMKF